MNADAGKPMTLRGEHLSNLHDYIVNNARLKWDESRGYSKAFAQMHDDVLDQIVSNPDQLVKLIATTDDICNCGCCPRLRSHCTSDEVAVKDKTVAARYGLTIGAEYTAQELTQAVGDPPAPGG